MILAESVRTTEVITTRETTSQFVRADGSNVTALTDVTVQVFIENLCSGKNADNEDNTENMFHRNGCRPRIFICFHCVNTAGSSYTVYWVFKGNLPHKETCIILKYFY